MCDRGGGTKWRRGWKAVQNVSFNLFPLLIADSIFSFFCFCFNPLALRALPLYRCATPRNATGAQQGERLRFDFVVVTVAVFLTPPSFGHLPYILRCKTQGRRIEKQPFSLYCFVAPRNAAGHGRGEIAIWFCCCYCRCFFNPSVLRTPPLYFAVQNTGEEDCKTPSSLYCFVAPRNATGHSRGEGKY